MSIDYEKRRKTNAVILKTFAVLIGLMLVGAGIGLFMSKKDTAVPPEKSVQVAQELSSEELAEAEQAYRHEFAELFSELQLMVDNEAFWKYGFGKKGRTAHVKWKNRVDTLQNTSKQVIRTTASANCMYSLIPGDLLSIAIDAMQTKGKLSPIELKRIQDIECVLNNQ